MIAGYIKLFILAIGWNIKTKLIFIDKALDSKLYKKFIKDVIFPLNR